MQTLQQIKDLDFSSWKCRCSGISNIMTSPTADKLPVGAITYIENEVDKSVFGFTDEINTKQFDKGNDQEDESIGVHNLVHFTNYIKQVGSTSNEYLTTQSCDVDDPKNDQILEFKTPWTKKTFPATKRHALKIAIKAGYPWQAQGYNSIYGRSKCILSNNLVSTNEDLCQWEDQTLHVMDNVPIELRNTVIEFEHSEILQAQIYARVKLCRIYMNQYLTEILTDHGLV